MLKATLTIHKDEEQYTEIEIKAPNTHKLKHKIFKFMDFLEADLDDSPSAPVGVKR